MTAEGGNSLAGHWAVRPWRAIRQLSSRTSLRIKLIAALLALVISALFAMGFVGISLLRGQLLAPSNNELQAVGTSHGITTCLNAYLAGNTAGCGGDLDIYLLTSGGQLQAVSTPSDALPSGNTPGGGPSSIPDLSGVTKWLASNTQQSITVPAKSGGDRWLVEGFPFTITNISTGAQTPGTVILATNVTSAYSTIHQLAGVDVIVSVVIVFVLAIVGFAVVQANLRPLVEIEETAEEIALARLDQQRPLARQPIDLLSLAADAVHDARLLAPARTIDLSVQPGAGFLVIGDEPRLRRVLPPARRPRLALGQGGSGRGRRG